MHGWAGHRGQFAAFVPPLIAHGYRGFGKRTYLRLIRRVERRVGAPMHRFDMVVIGRTAPVPPTLIIHDQDDTSAPASDAAAIATAWTRSRLQLTAGLGHRRLLSSPEVVADVVAVVSASR
jgi:pimeloyl-ACP methyl ester carboxylesterase